jgi:periplasmic copper chaperone A
MKHLTVFAMGVASVLMLGGHLRAQAPAASTIAVEQPWARGTPKGAKTAAAYMTLANSGTSAEKLLSAKTPVADKVQFHQETEENGVSRMREVRSIEIAPRDKVTFKPGSMHMMLVDLKQPLKQGDTFPLTLQFEHAGEVNVSVPVGKVGAMGSHDTNMMPGHPMQR